MAKFTIKDEGTWFYFDESDHTQGGVRLRLLTPLEEDVIERKVTKVSQKPHRGLMVESRKTNTALRNEMLYTKWIMDWKDIILDDKVLECNQINIMLMMTKVTPFARFVLDKILDLGEEHVKDEEAQTKNSESSSTGG